MPKSKRGKRKINSGRSVRSGGTDINAEQVNIGGDVVGRDKIVYEAASPIATSLHQLPPPPRDFIGREAELAELMSRAEGDGVTISGLHGMGGIGKTAMALVLADCLKDRYTDAQFYLDLKGASRQPLSGSEALAHVVRAYHPTAQLLESEDELRGLYQSVLHGQRALLLMDNAADSWQVEPLMPPSSCFLLVTSRQHFTLPGLYAKNLDTLPPDDARGLLLKIAERIDGHADAMAKLCGYLPLALRLAGSAMAERVTLTPEDYLRRLEDAKTRLALVDASLSLSYDLLGEDLKRAWCALSVFPDSFDLAAAAAVWDAEQEQAQSWLDSLVRYSLVEWDATAARAWLHDLARVFADTRLDDAARMTGQRRHAAHYLEVIRTANHLYLKDSESLVQGLALFDRERANIDSGQTWSATYMTGNDEVAKSCIWYARQWSILDLRLHPRDHILWIEAALVAARRLGDRETEGALLGDLGTSYHSLGEIRCAIEYYRQHLTIAHEIGDRQGEGNALGNLGLAYNDLGEHRSAIEYCERRQIIAREIGDRRGEEQALGNLGLAYNDLGEHRRAIDYFDQCLTVAREIGDRRGEGRMLGNLGLAYNNLGEYRRAIECQEQRLTITREMRDRHGEGQTLGNLGMAYHSLGEIRRAIECFGQHLTIAREIGDRRDESTALGNLGSAYFNLRDYQRAREYLVQQLTIATDIGHQYGEGNALWGLAVGFAADDDMPQAITHAEAALEIFIAIESPRAQEVRSLLAGWRRQR